MVSKMNEELEGLAFKDRKELANFNELDLLKIIEFLQIDRKEWINQYTRAHNDYVILKQEKDNLQNRIDKALDFIDCHFKEMVADEEAQELKSILKESGE